jgi:hypothetical protein
LLTFARGAEKGPRHARRHYGVNSRWLIPEADAAINGSARRSRLEALFSNGAISAESEVGGYDLFNFAPTDYPDFKLPGDYQGDQRRRGLANPSQSRDEKPEVEASRLWGVVTKNERGSRVLSCPGTSGIYGALLDAIVAKWPAETKET